MQDSTAAPPGRRAIAALACGGLIIVTLATHAAATHEQPDRRSSRAPAAWRADQVQQHSQDLPPRLGDAALLADLIPIVMAGAEEVVPTDAPIARVDANSAGSPYAGVCSLLVLNNGVTTICTGTPITRRHILTAGHCFDLDDDGRFDHGLELTIRFNATGSASHEIGPGGVLHMVLHPDFTGFDNPVVNDDLLLVTLTENLPAVIPHYPVYRGALVDGQPITLVGYGQSGYGDVGVTVNAALSVKRVGANLADRYFENDEPGRDTLEVWEADFDGPAGGGNCFGEGTLGNAVETSAAPGDSGGPAFAEVDGQLRLWGVNTFIGNCVGPAARFGGLTGGIVVNAYLPWIDLFVECGGDCADCNGNGVPDGVDLDEGALDIDANGYPDACANMGVDDVWLGDAGKLLGYSEPQDRVVWSITNHNFSAQRLRVAPDGGLLGAGTTDFIHQVYRIDPVTGQAFATFAVVPGTGPGADIVFDGRGFAYIGWLGAASGDAPMITRHDAATGAFVDVFASEDPAAPGRLPGGVDEIDALAVSPGGRLLVADGTQFLHAFDLDTGDYVGVHATLEGNHNFSMVRHRDGLLHVSTCFPGEIHRFDAASGAFIDTLVDDDENPGQIEDFAWDSDGRLLVLSRGFPWDTRLGRHEPETGAHVDTLLTDAALQVPLSLEIVGPDAAPHQPDIENDGDVDATDLVALLQAWGECPAPFVTCRADLDGDGRVGVDDLVRLILAWSP